MQEEDFEELDQSLAGLVENIENWTLDKSNKELLEIVKKQLKFEKIDPEYLCMGQLSGGILDYAVTCNVNIEIIRMIMENIDISVDLVNAYEEALPRSLVTAVKLDRLDIVKLPLKQQSKYPEFNRFSCLIVAIQDNNGRIF